MTPSPEEGFSTVRAGSGGELVPEHIRARSAILDWIDSRREGEGLARLGTDPALCRVAQERAEEVARAGRIESSGSTVSRVSRRVVAEGYEAHRWIERSLLGYRPPVGMVEAWSRSAQSSFGRIVLGDYEEVGVGVADAGAGTAVVLLLATSKASWFRDQVADLEDLEEVRRQALARVNRARQEAGVPPVRSDPELDAAAQAHSADMRDRGYYGHVSPQGLAPRDWVARTEYPDIGFLAENIAKGLFEPEEAVARWLDSRDHRRNILDRRATETGMGVAWGEVEGEYQVYWVQLFARPR